MPSAAARTPALEVHLLRQGVGRLVAGRDRCARCRRTPLVGERVYVLPGEKLVCALCLPTVRDEPERSEVVFSAERGHAVRLRARPAP